MRRPEKIAIRRMTADDIEKVLVVERACFSHPWSAEVFSATLLLPYAHYYVAEITDEDGTLAQIKSTFKETGRLIDTHTAVAYRQAEQYVHETGEKVVTVSTASPYKFAASVLTALNKKVKGSRGVLSPLYELSDVTETPIPAPLASLEGKPVRFSGAITKEDMPDSLFD